KLIGGVIQPSLLFVDHAEVVTRFGVVRIDLECVAECLFGLCNAPVAQEQNAEVVPGVRAARIDPNGGFKVLSCRSYVANAAVERNQIDVSLNIGSVGGQSRFLLSDGLFEPAGFLHLGGTFHVNLWTV